MFLTRKRAYARAGLLGNPSDGYHGKTVSFSVRNYWAEVTLYEWDSVEIVLAHDDRAKFDSVFDLARDVRLHGYYGGIRLIKATIKRFVEHCRARGVTLHDRKFSVRYQTTIPRQVGLAGSSAIIVATLRCLMEFYDVALPLETQPMFVLLVEQEELGITVGLQDRVIQVYEGLVYMDFDSGREHIVDGLRCYWYEPMAAAALRRAPRDAGRADRGVSQQHPRALQSRRSGGGRRDEAVRRAGGRRPRRPDRAGSRTARAPHRHQLRHPARDLPAAAVADRHGGHGETLRGQREVRGIGRGDSGYLRRRRDVCGCPRQPGRDWLPHHQAAGLPAG